MKPAFWLSVLSLLVLPALLFAGEVDVYLLGGQSNMQGIAPIADLPADLPKATPHTWFWTGRDFEPLVIGKTKTSNRAGEFGPEVGFALGLAANARPKYLIKYAASGMPLYHGWNGNVWAGGDPGPKRRNFYPGEKASDPNQGTLYREMLAVFQAGLRHLRERGDTPVVRGFLWMQGEQDAKHLESAAAYGASLDRLRNRLAADVDSPNLPLVFGQVLPHEPALPRFTHRAELRAAMAAADADSGQLQALKRVKMVSTNGFGVLPDTVHYNASGQLQLGQHMAAALQAMEKSGP